MARLARALATVCAAAWLVGGAAGYALPSRLFGAAAARPGLGCRRPSGALADASARGEPVFGPSELRAVGNATAAAAEPEAVPPGRLERIVERVRAKGLPWLVAYGLINTCFYNGGLAVVVATTKVDPVTMGSLLKCLAAVWAGGHLLKGPKYAGAIALTPVAERLLQRVQDRLSLKRRLFAAGVLTLGMFSVFVATWSLLLFGGSFGSIGDFMRSHQCLYSSPGHFASM